ncbi:MAG: hypothetical protein RLZZ344_1674 [Pseudomonadota bacterium]
MRRRFLWRSAAVLGALAGVPGGAYPAPVTARPAFPDVTPRRLVFPRDHGAHPAFRTEWWYLTAWLKRGPDIPYMGFQYTFFRSRTHHAEDNPSRFSPRQLLFAHAALAFPEQGRLLHEDRVARVGPAGVAFSVETTDLQLDGWRFVLEEGNLYRGSARTKDFTLSFTAQAPSRPLLRGHEGVSAKGPARHLASYYYSRTHLPLVLSCQPTTQSQAASAPAALWAGRAEGLAWIDHEWSSSLLAPGAVGWDWIGIHLLDGGSLMAFRIRSKGPQPVWQAWEMHDAGGRLQPVALTVAGTPAVQWQPMQTWESARSGGRYPVAFEITLGRRRLEIIPLMVDQEVDARASTGGFYWEGAVSLMESGTLLGRGYLELTGYAQPLQL